MRVTVIYKAIVKNASDLSNFIQDCTYTVHTSIRKEHENLCAFACALAKEEGEVSLAGNVDGVSEVVPR